jgi:hypothetical protein
MSFRESAPGRPIDLSKAIAAQMHLIMVGMLLAGALIDSSVGEVLKCLDNAGRSQAGKMRRHKEGKLIRQVLGGKCDVNPNQAFLNELSLTPSRWCSQL